jgi:hypothetical protein
LSGANHDGVVFFHAYFPGERAILALLSKRTISSAARAPGIPEGHRILARER